MRLPSPLALLSRTTRWIVISLFCCATIALAAPAPTPARIEKRPVTLEKRRGIHPRLFLNAGRVDELRKAIQTTHAPLWTGIKTQADALVRRGPPSYREDDGQSGE